MERLASDPNIPRVVLFGSFAEGRAVPGSDLDVMIVLAHD
ncbi:nucleotidyltransferase domain-containing protein [Methanoculleus bourgensis]|nr:nucleotidyltransferase domain-containing protein [Methanoculleus bourgensis]